jgi:GNAT superfamily N-acetyltransferase
VPLTLRRLTASDAADARLVAGLVRVFRAARERHLPFSLEVHSAAEDADYVARVMLPHHEVWAAEVNGNLTGFIAFAGDMVHHLFVAPPYQGRGVGSQLLEIAKGSRPSLQLWVFQVNDPAIRFYERHGFTVAERTDGANNQEKEPDARMVWTKAVAS